MPPSPSAAQRLRDALRAPAIVSAPGAHDTISARLVQEAGFPAVYMSGFGATAARLGLPDLGLMTQTEMTGHARDMVRATDIPVIADADTGYGGIGNLQRTVAEYAQAGVAAIHLEDQRLPKKCGQLGGLCLESQEDQQRRLRAALAARGTCDMMIIARTDALGLEGCDAAIARAQAYAETGVDMVFVDGVKTIEAATQIGRMLDFPKVLSVVDGTETANLTLHEIEQMGFDMAFHALSSLLSATHAVRNMLQALRGSGSTAGRARHMDSYDTLSRTLDLARFEAAEDDFG